jgi:hypothetical protein
MKTVIHVPENDRLSQREQARAAFSAPAAALRGDSFSIAAGPDANSSKAQGD